MFKLKKYGILIIGGSMKEEFLSKINSSKYVSNLLYMNVKNTFPSIIPNNFDIDIYNELVLKKEYIKYKDYFENMYKGIDNNIRLDEEQIKAILADEDYSLIIAGAGTGKTTTMAAKVKYLVDIKKIEPSKIVVMSFTKKSTQELEKRIVDDFQIPANVTTFHSLGMMYIREIFKNRKCFVVDENNRNQIFIEYFKEKVFPFKNKVIEILNIFDAAALSKNWVFGNYFKENYDKYDNFDDYFKSYKKHKIREISNLELFIEERIEKDLNQEDIYTIRRELVKSKKEARIANFLFRNGIEYQYEKVYPDLMEEKRTKKPDFTLNLGGESVYLEYFGLNDDKYNQQRKKTEEFHKLHNNMFISLDFTHDNLEEELRQKLINFGFVLKPKSYEEIYDFILDNNPTSQFYIFRNFLFEVIDTLKSSVNREKYKQIAMKYLDNIECLEKKVAERQLYYIEEFYLYYQSRLFGSENYGFDYSDMIYYANKYIEKVGIDNHLNFEYLIIDEYQDISQERYELTKTIAKKNKAKIVAVGDDWQSIYSFTGSKIEYIYNFQKYFVGSKILKITQTYRNSQQLISYSGDFIMKNPDQIKKQLISNKEIINPIRFVMFEDGREYEKLKELILKIHEKNNNHKILILARNNDMIEACFDNDLIDELGTKIKYVGYEDIDIDGMTIHKSKGLTSDEVIVIGLNSKFPHNEHNVFWLVSLLRPVRLSESIENAEERRLFYVALTRTKNYVYLLVNKNPKLRSQFINEIYNITQKEIKI